MPYFFYYCFAVKYVCMKKRRSLLLYALSIGWELGFFIAIPIGGFLFFGFLADSFFKTKPLFLIIGLIIGACIAGFGTYRFLMPFLNNDGHDNEK